MLSQRYVGSRCLADTKERGDKAEGKILLINKHWHTFYIEKMHMKWVKLLLSYWQNKNEYFSFLIEITKKKKENRKRRRTRKRKGYCTPTIAAFETVSNHALIPFKETLILLTCEEE